MEKNPYDFVPFPTSVDRCDRRQPQGRYLPDRYSGTLKCSLVALTPLVILEGTGQRGGQISIFRDGRETALPPASVRGMLRSAFEAVTNSCCSQVPRGGIIVPPNNVDRKTHPEIDLHKGALRCDLFPCADPADLCPACGMFGMVGKETGSGNRHEKSTNADEQATYGSRIRIRCPIPTPLPTTTTLAFPRMGQPHPWHFPFYFDSNGECLGRKFYYHHSDPVANLPQAGQRYAQYAAADKGSVFPVDVEFVNLSGEELTSLLRVLCPGQDAAHHLGYGKPLGFGAVQIGVTAVDLVCVPGSDNSVSALQTRYGMALPSSTKLPTTCTELEETLKGADGQWHDLCNAASFARWIVIQRWSSTPSLPATKYPDLRQFFEEAKSVGVTLAQYQQGTSQTITPANCRPKGLATVASRHVEDSSRPRTTRTILESTTGTQEVNNPGLVDLAKLREAQARQKAAEDEARQEKRAQKRRGKQQSQWSPQDDEDSPEDVGGTQEQGP